MQLSEQLYQLAGSSWKISLKRQFELIYIILTSHFELDSETVKAVLTEDYQRNKIKGRPNYQSPNNEVKTPRVGIANKRQQLHQSH